MGLFIYTERIKYLNYTSKELIMSVFQDIMNNVVKEARKTHPHLFQHENSGKNNMPEQSHEHHHSSENHVSQPHHEHQPQPRYQHSQPSSGLGKALSKMMHKMKLAHFNPKELEELDSWQGGRTDAADDLRHLSGVEELLSNPENEKIILKSYERHAKGGRIGELLQQADQMRHKGRHGDSEMALVGPNTLRIFNKLLNGGSVNPGTKKHEFFNLGGFLGGVGRTLSGGFNTMGSTLGQGVNNIIQGPGRQLASSAMNALPGAIMGGLEGGPEGALAGASYSMMGGQQAPQSLGQAGHQFMNSPMGQNAMNSSYGQRAQNMYQQGSHLYNQGRNLYNKGQQFAQSPTGQAMLNSSYGQRAQQMASPYIQQGQQAYNQGQNMYNQGQNAYNQADQGYQNMMQQGQHYNRFNDQQNYGQ